MKLVIADDESLVRVSLASMIKDMESDWNIVGEAANGEELLELIAEHQPNIAIVDIRMPKLNGLDAIRLGKAISPFTHWVILSGFSDFTFAQQALKLGASEYLLKPVNPVEFEMALQHIYKDNIEYIILMNQQFENQIFALCHGLTALKHEVRDSLLHRRRFVGWTFIIDTAQSANVVSALTEKFYTELRQCVDDHLVYGMNMALLALPSGELAAVAAWEPDKEQVGKQHISLIWDHVRKIMERYGSSEQMMTVLQTDNDLGFEVMNEQLHQLQSWADLRALCGIGHCLTYQELKRSSAEMLEGARLLSLIGQYLMNPVYLNYQKAVDELELLIDKSDLLEDPNTLANVRLFLQYTLGSDLNESISAAQMIGELRKYGEHLLREMKPKEMLSADLVIDQVVQYLEKNYMNDIGIGQIAGDLNISANYLSSLFHKKTGLTFVKYLTRIRLCKAKELLLNSNLQVKQIAEQVGYYSTRHFTKLFTESFGSYPSDYRKLNRGELSYL